MNIPHAQVERLEALLAKATPGPWFACNQDTGGCICGGVGSSSADVGLASTGSVIQDLFPESYEEDADRIRANAVIIAEAINALPQLLALARAVLDAPEAVVVGQSGPDGFFPQCGAIVQMENPERVKGKARPHRRYWSKGWVMNDNEQLLQNMQKVQQQQAVYERAVAMRKAEDAIRSVTGDMHAQLAQNAMMLAVLHPDAKVAAQAMADSTRHTMNMALAYGGLPPVECGPDES